MIRSGWNSRTIFSLILALLISSTIPAYPFPLPTSLDSMHGLALPLCSKYWLLDHF